MMKLAPAQFNCNIPLFHCVERFLQTFPNTFLALRSVECKFLLKAWSSNSCVIYGPMRIPSCFLTSLILEAFCLKYANPSLYLSTALTDNFIKPSLICNGSKQIFYLRTTADVPHSSDLVLFLNRAAIVLFCSGSPSLGCFVPKKNSIQSIRLAEKSALL
jgi:hypothetical protein